MLDVHSYIYADVHCSGSGVLIAWTNTDKTKSVVCFQQGKLIQNAERKALKFC